MLLINKKGPFSPDFIALIWCLCALNTVAQPKCETLDPHFKGDYPYEHFKDYVKFQLLTYAADTIHLSNRAALTLVRPVFLQYNEVVFQWDTFKLLIQTKKISFQSLSSINMVELGDPALPLIDSIDGLPSYGLSYREDSVVVISEMRYWSGKAEVEIPSTAFKNLFYPNFSMALGPIRPIAVYRNGEYSYLYIFGVNPRRRPLTELAAYDTYMAKLVFNASGFQTRIVANGGALTAYQWDCENFTGY